MLMISFSENKKHKLMTQASEDTGSLGPKYSGEQRAQKIYIK